MKEIVEQFINQIEEDQKLSFNTKSAYKSDLKELIDYIGAASAQLTDINQSWVKNYLNHLKETNKERNSYNRRASTFRLFLKFLYRNRLAPTNYSLIVDNLSPFAKLQNDDIEASDIKKIIEDTKLKIDQRLILLMLGKLGLDATQIVSLNTHQVDFENKVINLSDSQKVHLPTEIFTVLREYLLDVRSLVAGANEHLSLFLNEEGNPINEEHIYKLIKNLNQELNLDNKLTTRNLKRLSSSKLDILAMQREVLNMIDKK